MTHPWDLPPGRTRGVCTAVGGVASVFLAWPQGSCPCLPHGTNPCAGVQAAPDSIVPLSPSVSLWCSLAGGHSLLQPADPPDMRAQESDLRLRHRLHHQRHAHRGQPGAAQRHEIGTAWAHPLVYTVHGAPSTTTTACRPLLQLHPGPSPLCAFRGLEVQRPHPACPCMEPWPSCGGSDGGSEDGSQPRLYLPLPPPRPVCSTNSSHCPGTPGKLRDLCRVQ